MTDQGSVFLSKEFTTNCAALGIHLRHTGTESHNSLGSGETFHGPLRRIYGKLQRYHPNIPDDVRLSMSVHAMNITSGPDVIVPAQLVFGKVPMLPHNDSVPVTQTDGLRAMHVARVEYEKILAQRRIDTALTRRPPPNSELRL
jgi:hypothetical protein